MAFVYQVSWTYRGHLRACVTLSKDASDDLSDVFHFSGIPYRITRMELDGKGSVGSISVVYSSDDFDDELYFEG